MPNLAISAEDVGFLIVKAREFDVKEANSDPDSGSNAADDNIIDVLEDNGSDPVASEIAGFINALSEEEQVDLVEVRHHRVDRRYPGLRLAGDRISRRYATNPC